MATLCVTTLCDHSMCEHGPDVAAPKTSKKHEFYCKNPVQVRKFTDETNVQARNHENNDECRARPVRYLDLDTPAFYYYRKNPKCYHTVWGNVGFGGPWYIHTIYKYIYTCKGGRFIGFSTTRESRRAATACKGE